MALRLSTGARNFMAGVGSFKDAFQDGRIEIYTGSQPLTADAAVTGTLICTITANSAAFTPAVLSSGSVTLTGGATGSVDSITVSGVQILGVSVPFNTSLSQTAADVATQINTYNSTSEYVATSSGAVITITAKPGTGTVPNGFAVLSTGTTITTSNSNMLGGVAPANGLRYGAAVSAIISKLASQTWSGVNANTNTAGWYRMYGCIADAGAVDSNGVYIREDGAISTSGAELNMASTALVSGATTTIASWSHTLPTL